jgi:8-oxo-dGTP pyrophosphatase MutT (NUDIX family)
MSVSRQAAVVIVQAPSGRILVLLRGASAPYAPLHWNFPGGYIERGESGVEGALRELREETGLRLPKSRLSYLLSMKGVVTTHVLTASVAGEYMPTLPDGENIDYRWIALPDMPQPATREATFLAQQAWRKIRQMRA